MDYSRALKKTKFFFQWNFQGTELSSADTPEIQVTEVRPESLLFSPQSVPHQLKAPQVKLSIQVRNQWHEHSFSQSSWLHNEKGEVYGIQLEAPLETLQTWKKNLEMGLCV